jgi:hypothetical protein
VVLLPKMIVIGSDRRIGVLFKNFAKMAGQAVRLAPESIKTRVEVELDTESAKTVVVSTSEEKIDCQMFSGIIRLISSNSSSSILSVSSIIFTVRLFDTGAV